MIDSCRHVRSISSLQNSVLKQAAKLRDRRERERQSAFLVEGEREVSRALASGFQMKELFFCRSLLTTKTQAFVDSAIGKPRETRLYELSLKCFNQLVVRKGFDGICVVFAKSANLSLIERLKDSRESADTQSQRQLYLVLDHIEKPGNLGAIFRSADGAGVNGIVLLQGCGDPYAPQAIRSSLGTVFSVPWCHSDVRETQSWLTNNKISAFSAALSEESIDYSTANFTEPCAFVLGSEAHGVRADASEIATKQVMIPMMGLADSLNVSVAGAVLLYEARRQKDLFAIIPR